MEADFETLEGRLDYAIRQHRRQAARNWWKMRRANRWSVMTRSHYQEQFYAHRNAATEFQWVKDGLER